MMRTPRVIEGCGGFALYIEVQNIGDQLHLSVLLKPSNVFLPDPSMSGESYQLSGENANF